MSHESSSPRRVGCLSRTVYIALLAVLICAFAGGSIYLLWYYALR